MNKRVLTALVGILLMIPFLIFSDTVLLNIFSVVLTCIGVFEILRCAKVSKNLFVTLPSLGVAFVTSGANYFYRDKELYTVLIFIFLSYLIYLLTVAVFSRGKIAITDVTLLFAMTMYISMGFSSIVTLRHIDHGEYIYILAFLLPWITDSAAYFVGTSFGKHKLIPEISPKKSVEGAIGGVVFGTLTLVIYGFAVGVFFEAAPKYTSLVITGIIITVISQIGDLVASAVKRHYGVKDYGRMFPGHGGVLDRFDSVIATAAFMNVLCTTSSFFNLFTL